MREFYKSLEHDLFEKNYKSWQVYLIYLFLAFIVFSPSFLNLNYFWDDERFIFLNPEVLQAPNLVSFWNSQSPFFKSWPLGYGIFWSLLKYSPFDSFVFFKSLNIIFHSANALLLFIILKKYFFKSAIIIPAFFLIHPLQVETVSWIFQLLTILATTFFLLSLLTFCHYLTSKKNIFVILSLAFFLFSIWTKSIAIFTPVFFILIAFYYRADWKRYIPLLAFFILSIYVGFYNLRGTRAITNEKLGITSPFEAMFNTFNSSIPAPFEPIKEKVQDNNQKLLFDFIYKKQKPKSVFEHQPLTIFQQAPVHYLYKLFVPIKLQFIYQERSYGIVFSILATMVFFILPMFAAIKLKERKWLLLSGIAIVFLLPYLGITNITFFYWSKVSDRYMYGLILYMVFLVYFLIHNLKWNLKKIIFGYFILLLCLSINYGMKFNNSLKLYEEIISYKKHPIIYSLLFEQHYLNIDEINAAKVLNEGLELFPNDLQLNEDLFRLKALQKSQLNFKAHE